MRTRHLLILLLTALAASPAMAKVLAEGAAKNGYYWQKVETSSGNIRYICRSTSDSKFQKNSKCEDAGAQEPN